MTARQNSTPVAQEPENSGSLHRLVLPLFFDRVEAELQANQKKGDWREWKPSPTHLVSEMQWHMHKLTAALYGIDYKTSHPLENAAEKIAEYAADIAAYSQKAFELYGQNRELFYGFVCFCATLYPSKMFY